MVSSINEPHPYNLKRSQMLYIHTIEAVTPKPCKVKAIILLNGSSQPINATKTVTTKTTGIAVFAGQRKPTGKIPARSIGIKANKA